MKKVLVCGAGGFIGGHLVSYLKNRGDYVVGVDIKHHEHKPTDASKFIVGDLRDFNFVKNVTADHYDEIYQLAADMGGAGYIFTGENDAAVMHNSATINLNILESIKGKKDCKIFYSSSACIYPEHNQLDSNNPNCEESSAYPANPDSEYGWEKLFSERLYFAYSRNYNVNVRVARFHNIFGPYGTWQGGKEKAPAALCRKVASSQDNIEIWGDGNQTRSFLYVDECVEGIIRLMDSEFCGPVNIGSDEMISINDLAKMVIGVAMKNLDIINVNGPIGVRGRNSDNNLISQKLNWRPSQPLKVGIEKTYQWINEEIQQGKLNK